MYLYQYILLAGFTCLLFSKEVRFASVIFLTGWAVYLVYFIDAPSNYKYVACGAIELSIAYILNRSYRIVAYIGYSLILVNIYGLLLIVNKLPPASYDIIYALLSVTQFLILIIRANLNGILRLSEQYWLVRLINFDSGQARGIMCKNKATKEAHR